MTDDRDDASTAPKGNNDRRDATSKTDGSAPTSSGLAGISRGLDSTTPRDPIVDTDPIPVQDADAPTGGTGTGAQRRLAKVRSWKYIKGTRIRTSTAVLLVAFICSWVLFGFASQRYTPDTVPSTGGATRTSEPTYEEPSTTESRPSLSSESSSSEPSLSGTDDEQSNGSESTDSTTSTQEWLPSNLPQQLSELVNPTTTTTVPTR